MGVVHLSECLKVEEGVHDTPEQARHLTCEVAHWLERDGAHDLN